MRKKSFVQRIKRTLKDVFESLLKAELKIDTTIEHCYNSSVNRYHNYHLLHFFSLLDYALSPISYLGNTAVKPARVLPGKVPAGKRF